MKKLLFFWKELIATFWFLPVLILALSIVLSMGLVYIDHSVSISIEGWIHFFLVKNPDSARSILSTISSAMIGVAGTVFSVTLVALTLASSQFGPRLIKNFMYVKLNQVVLGSYVSTYLYCLLVLNTITDNEEYSFVPSFSILLAILAAMVNIILLIVFIHKIATSIQADKVISDISDFISKQVESLFPEEMGVGKKDLDNLDTADVFSTYQKRISLKSPKSGYVQYIDSETLIELVTKHDAIMDLHHRPGGYVVKDEEIGLLYAHSDLEKEKVKKVFKQFVIGKTKTAQQDLEFSIHQMVEIAARALSPGINDPYTAIACIDNLTSTMCYLAKAKFPSKYRFDEDGKLRVIAKVLNFEGVLNAAFNQIRQFSESNPAVIIRLMEALVTLHEFTNKESHRKAVVKHIEMVLSSGKQTISERNDIDDLTKRAQKVLSIDATE